MSLHVDIEKRLGNFWLRVKLDSEGGITGLLGMSGCGKSMTLKCIAGIERPDRGHIELDGRVLFDSEKKINLKPQDRRVGYLFQNYALFPDMTVMQNILCGLHREKDKNARYAATADAIKLLHLEGLEDRKPHQLSGGQQQRVALARILVNRPALLMLDEPFSALDTHLRMRLQIGMLQVLKDAGCPVLLVTHSRDEAYHMCDRLGIMGSGTMSEVRPTKEVFADPRTVDAAMITGCKNIAPARRTGEHTLFVPDWGVTLTTALPVPEDADHVGIRAHYFQPKTGDNRFPVTFAGEMEEPFEWVVEFRYAGQALESPALWWRMPKDRRTAVMPPELGVAPVNVLPLRQV